MVKIRANEYDWYKVLPIIRKYAQAESEAAAKKWGFGTMDRIKSGQRSGAVGGATSWKARPMTAYANKIKLMLDKDMSVSEIATILNKTDAAINSAIKRHGINKEGK
jgi:hypothetical protein